MLLVESIVGVRIGIPPYVDIVLIRAVEALILYYFLRVIGRENNEKQVLAFVIELLVPVSSFGLIFEIRLPLVLVVDLGLAFYLEYLSNIRKYSKKLQLQVLKYHKTIIS